MTVNVSPYLSFSGRCAEAFEMYEKVLGGEIVMRMRYRDAPVPSDPAAADQIMHICLRIGAHELMGADVPPGHHRPMAGMSVAVALPTADAAHAAFAALSDGGHVGMPMAETFWTKAFGMVVDRFGTPWIVSAEMTSN